MKEIFEALRAWSATPHMFAVPVRRSDDDYARLAWERALRHYDNFFHTGHKVELAEARRQLHIYCYVYGN